MTKDADINRVHREKKVRIKQARDRMMETKTQEKGLLIVNTGAGKGKSTAGFGMALRCIGWGMRVGIVQFIKGQWDTGEKNFLARFPDLCVFASMGEGFTWETQDRERDIRAAQKGWQIAKEQILDPAIGFVLLDEINTAIRYGYVDADEVVAFLKNEKPAMTHVCLTGRNAAPALIEIADLVTEMTLVKHPFKSGVKAQKGIEF